MGLVRFLTKLKDCQLKGFERDDMKLLLSELKFQVGETYRLILEKQHGRRRLSLTGRR